MGLETVENHAKWYDLKPNRTKRKRATIQVKDMVLKDAIEERRAEDARAAGG